MHRPGVLIYHTIVPQLEMLSDDEAGKLFRALLQYSLDGCYDPLPRIAELVMLGHVPLIDRDNVKYEKLCQQRREAAIARWRKNHPGQEPDLSVLGPDPSPTELADFANQC